MGLKDDPKVATSGELPEKKPKKKAKRPQAEAGPAKTRAARDGGGSGSPAEGAATRSGGAAARAAAGDGGGSGTNGGTDLGTKISASIALVAAIGLGVVLNVYAARHYTRWDFTKGGEFTLSAGTIETLRTEDQPVQVLVLLSKDLPLGASLAEMLDSYKQHSDKLVVEFVDPDRDQTRLLEVQRKYGLLSAENGGRTMTDAAVVVVRGDRHRYILHPELIQVDEADDMRVRPRLEYALTSALRELHADKRTTLCFTTGHGELTLEAGGVEGMAELRERLHKSNYEVVTVFEPTADSAKDPLSQCELLVVAAPRAPVSPEHVEAMKRFVLGGGNALVVVWPVPNAERNGWVSIGLDDLIALAGVRVEKDLVIEADPSMRATKGEGTVFFTKTTAHPVTQSLLSAEASGVGASLAFASSLQDLGGSLKAEKLLTTSPKSFGVMNYWAREEADRDLKPGPDDHEGPLTVAVATMRPPTAGQKDGARMVVVSAANPLWGASWSVPELQGTGLFTEGAISWLAAREQFLDIPDKPLKTTGIKLTEDALTAIFRYVVVLIPFAVTVLGIGVFMLRRRRPARKGGA